MIYEVRTYTLKTGAVAEFEDRFAGYQTSNGNIRIIGPAPASRDGKSQEAYNLRTITAKFFEPLVPRPPRRPDAQVDVNIALQDPLVRADD